MKQGKQYRGIFRIGEAETLRYNLHRAKWRIVTLGACFGIFLFVLLLLFFRSQGLSWLLGAVSALPISIAVGLFAAYLRIYLLRQKIAKAYLTGSVRPFVQNISLNDHGISVLSGGVRTAHSWGELLRRQENGYAFYLYFPARQTYFLPKAQMDGEDAIRLVRSILSGIRP